MRPKKLIIKGLNSFKEKQIIDFEKLVSKGLFGIFGETGSGKSTILDAITYSLYGKIIRGNSEFINVTENAAQVSYEFEIYHKGSRRTYLVERSAKRDKKDNKYKTSLVRLIEKENDKLEVIAEGKREVDSIICEVIGLNFQDFTKAIVLPQGQFSGFLKAKPSDRRDMLERIFGLEKYGRGLSNKIKSISNETKDKLNEIKGKLSGYEGINNEKLKEIELELENLLNEESVYLDNKKKIDNTYNIYKQKWELQNELRSYNDSMVDLLNKESYMDDLKLKVEKAEKALEVIGFVNNVKKNKTQLNDNIDELKLINIKFQSLFEEQKLLEKEKENIDFEISNIPKITKEIGDFKRAIKLKNEVTQLDKEVKNLYNIKEENSFKKEALVNNLNIIDNKIKLLKQNLNKYKNSISELKVDIEYREKVNNLFIKEKEYKELINNINELNSKKNICDSEIEHNKNILQGINTEKNENLLKINTFNKKLEDLKNSFDGDNTKILDINRNLNKLESKYNDFQKYFNDIDELKNKVSLLENDKIDIDNELNSNKNILQQHNNTIKNLNKEIEKFKMANLAIYLAKNLDEGAKCPVCGSKYHKRANNEFNTEILNESYGDINSIKCKLEKLESDKESLINKINYSKVKSESINKQISEKLEILKELNIKVQDVKLEDLKKEYETSKIKYEELKSFIEKWYKDKEILSDELNKLKEKQISIESKSIKYNERLIKGKEYLDELNCEINNKCEKEKILNSNYVDLKKQLDIKDIETELLNLKSREEKIRIIEKQEYDLENQIQSNLKNRDLNKEKLNKLSQAVVRNEENLILKEKSIEYRLIEIKELSNDKNNLEELLHLKIQHLDSINKNQYAIESKLKLTRKNLDTIYKHKCEKEGQGEQLKENLKSSILELNKAIQKNNFKNESEIENYILSSEEILKYKNVCKAYDEKLQENKINIERIQKKLNNKTIKEKQWIEICDNKEQVEKNIIEIRERKAKKQQELDILKEKLFEIKEIVKVKDDLAHKKYMLEDIEKLTQGNKLVEFVSMSKLKYVALEASKRLNYITCGKYALEISEDGNFIMRDDHNGGIRRTTNSLSGGETFLTSLSLALALSSQIQLRGNSPLEFFFLDEGFGSLDSSLLDIVMNSLEKLRSEKLCIGIISHIEELKDRVPVKIIVTPSNFGQGSKIRIEES